MKALHSFETHGTIYPTTQRHIPGDLNPHLDSPGFKSWWRHEIFLHNVHTGCGHYSIVFNGNWGSLQGAKRPGGEINHLITSSAEIKNEWSYTSKPSILLHAVDKTSLFCPRVISNSIVRDSNVTWLFLLYYNQIFLCVCLLLHPFLYRPVPI